MYVDIQSSGVLAGKKAHMGRRSRVWDANGNYRARATKGVAVFALILLFPFSVYALSHQLYAITLGGTFVVSLLIANTYLISNGRDHEPLTLYALIPGSILFIMYAFTVNGNIASVGCFPSIIAFYCILSRRKADIASVVVLAATAPLICFTFDLLGSVVLIGSLSAVILFASILLREIECQQEYLKFQIAHDPMTGLLNRTCLNGKVEEAINSFQRLAIPSSLLTVDLDHFKRVNDVFGHDTGDVVLCKVARLLEQNISNDCSVFRLGGEEFLILLGHNDANDAQTHAELLRLNISQTTILPDFPITVSIGVANLRVSDDNDSWRRRSDNLLYMAKLNGRNRVVSEDDIDSRKKLHIRQVDHTGLETY